MKVNDYLSENLGQYFIRVSFLHDTWQESGEERRKSFEHLPLVPLIGEELAAFDYFDTEDNDITYDDGKTVRSKEPKYWLPHSKYILGNKPLSAVLLSPTH